jgi:UDP-N-acetyl-D-mannosaminuronic acid dehydrogenase
LLVAEQIAEMECDLIVIEPNIEQHDSFVLYDPIKAYESADLLVFLVKHRRFVDLVRRKDFSEKTVLDYCGIL